MFIIKKIKTMEITQNNMKVKIHRKRITHIKPISEEVYTGITKTGKIIRLKKVSKETLEANSIQSYEYMF